MHSLYAIGLLVCLTAAPVFATEGGGEDPIFSTAGWVYRFINFGVIVAGLLWLLLKKAPAAFHGRAERIASSISEAAQAKQEAERRLREAEGKLERLDQEVRVMQESAQRDAAAEAERIRTTAKEEAAKIARAAEMEILAAERAARMELKALAARLSVERAEAVLRGEMTPATEAALFRAFVSDLGRSAN
ncbi:MAG: ATP synthase F0 subunit B [Acidobacteria bacterium]|nr:ATP synthase F0 subunit B [Acidobacteriota bacterium]MBI3662100.1 ATP synthase F0 subunit B [Acidobacteriota bacterium]